MDLPTSSSISSAVPNGVSNTSARPSSGCSSSSVPPPPSGSSAPSLSNTFKNSASSADTSSSSFRPHATNNKNNNRHRSNNNNYNNNNNTNNSNAASAASSTSSSSDIQVKVNNTSPRGKFPLYSPEVLNKFASEWEALEQEELSSADYYFNSYAHFGIHEEMLKDTVRTGAYQRAILNNKHLFKDKIVLDVGAGTGILCFFAAKAGAKMVYGIECSEIVEVARKIAHENNLSDRVQFIRGKAEEVELPVEKVDILLSEWMGYFLLYESMLDTVLYCRDKWLKKGGLIFPDKARLYIAAIEDGEYKEEKIGYWEDVYGFDYSCVRKCVMEEPIVDTVDCNAIATTECPIVTLDLNTCTAADLDFCATFEIQLRRKDFVHALIAWFDIIFSACHKPITFSTSPYGRYTHWKQTVFYMEHVLVANKDEVINGIVAVKKSKKNPRDLDIKMMYDFKGAINPVSNTQYYRLR